MGNQLLQPAEVGNLADTLLSAARMDNVCFASLGANSWSGDDVRLGHVQQNYTGCLVKWARDEGES